MSADPDLKAHDAPTASGLSAEEQQALVFEYLARREQIAAETKASLQDRGRDATLDPLADVDPKVREEAEEAYYAKQGKRRYRTSDGRTLFLAPEEIAQRRRARSQRHRKTRPRFYGPTSAGDSRRWWLGMGFNVGAVVLGLIVVWLILH